MKIGCCLLALICSLSLMAQNGTKTRLLEELLATSKQDTTRVSLLCKLSLVEQDSAKSMDYGRKALRLSEQLQSDSGIARSYYVIAMQYEERSEYSRAIEYHSKALPLADKKKLQSKILTAMGSSYMYESRYTKALSSYHRALKIDESLGDKEGIAKLAMNIASVYYSIKDYPKSIAYFNKAINLKIKDPAYNSFLFRNLGAVYNTMGKYDKALNYFEQSLALCEQLKDDDATASLLSDIALVYYDTESYEKAIYYSKASLKKTPPEAEDKLNIAFSYGIIGDSYTEMAKSEQKRVMLDSAVFYLRKSIALHSEVNNIRGLYDDYTSLANAQKQMGDFKSAMASYETSIVYKDSIFNSDNRETIKNIEDKRAIELRDKELKINRITLDANQRQKWLLIGGIFLLVIIGCMLFYQSNNRKRNNRKLNRMNADLDRANNIKTRLLGILNHDLRSPVNSFIHFIQFQKESPEMLDADTKSRIENQTLASAKNLLYSMEDILLWTKDQMKNFEPQPKPFRLGKLFDAVAMHFSAIENLPVTFEYDKDFEINTDENYLKTIVRNLTANAINATHETENPKIVWRAWQENGHAALSISDNGPGADDSQWQVLYEDETVGGVRSGLGLHLVRDLAKAIGCKISVTSEQGKGTTVKLDF